VLLGGPIYTRETAAPWADGLAVRGDRIVAVSDVEPFIGEQTTVIDLDGRLVLPGFHDDRVDLHAGAEWLRQMNEETGTPEIRRAVRYLHRFGITSVRPVDGAELSEDVDLRLVEDGESERRFGSGWPRATADPLVALHREVTGRDLDGRVVSRTREPVEDALAKHLTDPLRVGGLADVTVIQDNLLKTLPDRIAESKVEMTVFDGTIVYESATFDHNARATLK